MRVAAFYARWFGASVGERYENPRKGFASRFLEFGGGARLEVMTRTDIGARAAGEQLGLAHIAITVGNEAAVDALAARLAARRCGGDRRAAAHRRWLLRMRGARSGRQSRGNRGRLSMRKHGATRPVDPRLCRLRRGGGANSAMAGSHRRPPGPGPAGGGRPARSSARRSSRELESAGGRGHRRRRDHADLRRARLRRPRASSSCRRAGSRCSNTPRAKQSASAWVSTWPPARAGPSAVRR